MTKPLDNLERTDWILARNVLDIVQEYYTEPRLITITNESVSHETESLEVNGFDEVTGEIVNDLTLGEYSIIITSTPHRASLEDSQFEQAKELRELGVQIPDRVLIENSRLQNRADIIKAVEGDQESPEAQAQKEREERAAEAEVSKMEAEVQNMAADAQLKQVRAQKEATETENDTDQIEMMKVQAEIELQRWKMEQEFALKREELEMEMQLKREQHAQDMQLRRVESLRKQAQQPQGESTNV